MRWVLALAAIAALAAGALSIWVRSLDVAPARHHARAEVPAAGPGDYPARGGHMAVRRTDDAAAALRRLHEVVRAAPRTRVLAGSVEEGHVSYVTRTAIMGFPDVTNAWTDGDLLVVQGHLIFGQADLGVNRRRIEGWLSAVRLGGD